MRSLARAWVARAEAELATAVREAAVTEAPNYDAACLHAKTCALDYLRARLEEADVPFPMTSHLVVLLELCLELEPGWEGFRQHLRHLTTAAEQGLDPEFNTTQGTAIEALEQVRIFRAMVLQGAADWAVAEPVG